MSNLFYDYGRKLYKVKKIKTLRIKRTPANAKETACGGALSVNNSVFKINFGGLSL